MNNNHEKSNVSFEIDSSCNNIYNFNFAQNLDDDFSNSAKSNGTSLSVDLNSCNIDTLNNSDNQIIPVCKEASKVNNEAISESINTRDANTQPDAQLSFDHGTINNN